MKEAKLIVAKTKRVPDSPLWVPFSTPSNQITPTTLLL